MWLSCIYVHANWFHMSTLYRWRFVANAKVEVLDQEFPHNKMRNFPFTQTLSPLPTVPASLDWDTLWILLQYRQVDDDEVVC